MAGPDVDLRVGVHELDMMRSFRSAVALLLLGALALAAVPAFAVQELVRNGDFVEAMPTGLPVGWTNESWLKSKESTAFSWQPGENGIGIASIESRESNDASWVQSAGVSPSTWYRIAGWIRAENVGTDHMGAYISAMDTFFYSEDLRGTRPWTPVELWVKTGSLDTSIKIALRLGGYSSLNVGKAEFAMISVEPAGSPPRGTKYVYGGNAETPAAGSIPLARLAALLVAAGVGYILWRYMFGAAGRTAEPGSRKAKSAVPDGPLPEAKPENRPAKAGEAGKPASPGALRRRKGRGRRAGMEKVRFYHNPVCGKSRGALEILEQRGVETEVIEYLKTPPDRKTLEGFLDLLGGEPGDLMRKDKRFKELGLDPKDYVSRKQVVDVLLKYPELMERPVVIRGGRAVIARPSERVLELFEKKR